DDAEQDDVGSVGGKVIETSGQNISEIGYSNGADLREPGVEIFGRDPGAACRADDQPGKLELIGCPLDRVSDGHLRSSRTAGSRAAGHPWQHTRSGRRSRE